MKVFRTSRGFERIDHPTYPEGDKDMRLVQQSSAIGNYEDAEPGSSYLWIGDNHHLNREEVAELVKHLTAWLNTKSLET